MKSFDLVRKLDNIGESMKEVQIEGTTRIDWNCLSQRERVLFDRVNEIRDEYWPQTPPEDVLEENHPLFVKGIEIMMRRAIDLFRNVVKTSYVTTARDDPLFDLIFTTRLHWFLHEMRRHAERIRREEELWKKYEKYEDFARAWKEFEEQVEDKTALWSQESFERFIRPLLERMHRKHGKHG